MSQDEAMQTDARTDLIIIGAGILGLATAFRAHQRELSIRVIGHAGRPVGSSIMNFDRAYFTGQTNAIQDVVTNTRSGWTEAAQKTGLWAATSGTCIPAVTETEIQLLEEFTNHRGSDRVKLMSRSEIANAIGSPNLKCLGGAYLPLDMHVSPRKTAPRLATWLESQDVIFNWRHGIKTVAGGHVDANRKRYQAERIICCPNFWLTSLLPELADEHEVRVYTLQTVLVERPIRIPKDIALFAGTSLAHYDGFAGLPSVATLRQELRDSSPELVNCVANVMSAGIEEDLFIGDSHAYNLSPDPFLQEETPSLLLDTTCKYPGIKRSKVIQRWQGRYSDSTKTNFILEQLGSQTTVAVVASDIGMVLPFGTADLALQGTKPAELAGF